MISTGNDIVALNGAGANRAGQSKFYSKIITQPEFDLYCSKKFATLSFENYVWLLWSIKEAVYKYQKRNNPALRFSPKKIIAKHVEHPVRQRVNEFLYTELEKISFNEDGCYTCKIQAGVEVFYSKSKVYDDVVHTTVNNTEDFGNIYWGIKQIESTDGETQSKNVRWVALNALTTLFPNENLQITKTDIGIPLLFKNDIPTNIPLSFAHHENFVGYSFLLQPVGC